MIDFAGVPELDHSDSPHFQAFKRMEDNKPPYPTALLKELGAYVGLDCYKQPLPNFRGWFALMGGRAEIYNWQAIPNDADINDIGYVGIWRGVVASKDRPIIWCALPSMMHGDSVPGETIEVGTERVRIGYKQEDLDAMVVQGYEIMMRMIAEHGEYKNV